MLKVDLIRMLRASTSFPTASRGADLLEESSSGAVEPSSVATSAMRDLYRLRQRRAPGGVHGLDELVPALDRQTSERIEMYSCSTEEQWVLVFASPEGELVGCVVGTLKRPIGLFTE